VGELNLVFVSAYVNELSETTIRVKNFAVLEQSYGCTVATCKLITGGSHLATKMRDEQSLLQLLLNSKALVA
jgi:hypothetical protein